MGAVCRCLPLSQTLPPLLVFNIWHHTVWLQRPPVCFHRAGSVFWTQASSLLCWQRGFASPGCREHKHSVGEQLLPHQEGQSRQGQGQGHCPSWANRQPLCTAQGWKLWSLEWLMFQQEPAGSSNRTPGQGKAASSLGRVNPAAT